MAGGAGSVAEEYSHTGKIPVETSFWVFTTVSTLRQGGLHAVTRGDTWRGITGSLLLWSSLAGFHLSRPNVPAWFQHYFQPVAAYTPTQHPAGEVRAVCCCAAPRAVNGASRNFTMPREGPYTRIFSFLIAPTSAFSQLRHNKIGKIVHIDHYWSYLKVIKEKEISRSSVYSFTFYRLLSKIMIQPPSTDISNIVPHKMLRKDVTAWLWIPYLKVQYSIKITSR